MSALARVSYPRISAPATVSMAGGSDVTLTLAQYQQPVLILTGAITANINLVFPLPAGEWAVLNNTTSGSGGPYTVSAKNANGTAGVIDRGAIRRITSDGTNVNVGGEMAMRPTQFAPHSYFDFVVPRNGNDWRDNVATIQNNSISTTNGWSGNACWRFVDNVNGYERGAMGYSRVNTGTPGGFYANTLYCEVGNLTPGDVDDTDFKVIVTHPTGVVNFPGTSLIAFEVRSSTGDIFMRTQGAGLVNVGQLGSPCGLALNGSTTRARLRERRMANQFAFTTNISDAGSGEAQDDTSKSSWSMDFGGGDDSWTLRRLAAGASPVGDPLAVLVSVDGATGRMMVNQSITDTAGGADGMFAVTGGGNSRSAQTLRQTDGLPCQILYNTGTTGDNKLVDFGTEATYTRRGGINYSRSGGVIVYGTTSDYRAKTVNGPIANPLETLALLKPYTGRMHGATQDIEFFVAHELQQVVPVAVTGEKDAMQTITHADGTSEAVPEYQTVDNAKLVPLLVAAVQALQAEVEALRAKVGA